MAPWRARNRGPGTPESRSAHPQTAPAGCHRSPRRPAATNKRRPPPPDECRPAPAANTQWCTGTPGRSTSPPRFPCCFQSCDFHFRTLIVGYSRVQNTCNSGSSSQLPSDSAGRIWQSRAATLIIVAPLYSRDELVRQRALWKQQGKTVVFTNGCYDLLHPGHIRSLEGARSLGDVLVLALNSDAGVRRMKGQSRPLLGERERAEIAQALLAVDAVTFFDEETPQPLVAALLPDVLVKGADWSHFVAGREEVEAAGGRVETLPLEPGYSTTNLVEVILNQP